MSCRNFLDGCEGEGNEWTSLDDDEISSFQRSIFFQISLKSNILVFLIHSYVRIESLQSRADKESSLRSPYGRLCRSCLLGCLQLAENISEMVKVKASLFYHSTNTPEPDLFRPSLSLDTFYAIER